MQFLPVSEACNSVCRYLWIERCAMDRSSKEWRKLASAFYALAHNDEREFNELEPELKETEVGQLCSEYIRTKDFDLIEKAGYLLTHTKYWYVYIGRSM